LRNKHDILFVSDLHAPYHHPDALPFLAALHKKYQFGRIVCLGDELDWHGLSYHDKDPDLHSAGEELKKARGILIELNRIFPLMDIIESNHGSLAFRKATTCGFPKHTMTSYADTIFGERDKWGNLFRRNALGVGWIWHKRLVIDLGNGHKVLIVHGDGTSANSLRNTKEAGMSFVSGHWHSTFEIQYHSTSEFLHFGMIAGCLIDPDSPAFAYGAKRVFKRPIIGCGAIINGQPKLLPMPLKRGGRWDGIVP